MIGIYGVIAAVCLIVLVIASAIAWCSIFCSKVKKEAEWNIAVARAEAGTDGFNKGWDAAADWYAKD